jgi:hypothetical protein
VKAHPSAQYLSRGHNSDLFNQTAWGAEKMRRLICTTLIIAGLFLSGLHVAAYDQCLNELVRDLNKKGVALTRDTFISNALIGSYPSEGKILYIYFFTVEKPRVDPVKGLYFFLADYGKPSGSLVCFEEIEPLRDAVNRFIEIDSQSGAGYYYYLTKSRWLLLELINNGEPGDYYLKITTDSGHFYLLQNHDDLVELRDVINQAYELLCI